MQYSVVTADQGCSTEMVNLIINCQFWKKSKHLPLAIKTRTLLVSLGELGQLRKTELFETNKLVTKCALF